MVEEKANKINCVRCIHFAVTWEAGTPKSCKFYGFKSAQMPSVVVLQSSGSQCVAFQEKVKKG